MSGQLDLFGGGSKLAVGAIVDDEERALAAQLPSWIRLGSSSWSFPGWKNVWAGTPSADDLARDGLTAYATHPLFRTVGLDRSYYGPLRDEDLAAYATQLDATRPPHGFKMVSKVWDEITTAVFPAKNSYGARAGQRNASFLDVGRFVDEVLGPYVRTFSRYAGPFVFELTPMPRGTFDDRTLTRLIDSFLSQLGRVPEATGFRWAFELRNEELLGSRWFDMLAANGAAHVFNFWTAMPSLRVQLAKPRSIASRFVVARLMLPPYARHDAKKVEYAPFDRLVEIQPEMREDVVRLLRIGAEWGCDEAFILVGNKSEGSAPLTIRALAAKIARELSG